ncbi:transglycosylase SLT domain-containing protein [Desulfogranum mediterraneum]|uniref:transglycosylase SLT domain-containing protein n=1 Tax=Desulfogranum mediterraneum TaxID=160661 RepID=UPI00048E6DBE|nr:transglycosylase SLT domain-containing protein [Desulfogranum mediterraneum]
MVKTTLVSLLAILVLLPGTLLAAIYSYQDEHGAVHYTNIPADGRLRLRQGVTALTPSSQLQTIRCTAKPGQKKRVMSPRAFYRHIRWAAALHKVDPLLIRAIIKAESDFNPLAVSSQGAQGLMQLMPGTAGDLKVSDPFDVRQNIEGGTRYFRGLLDCYHGDVELSLAAYNAGPGRVKPFGTIPRIPETMAYVTKVMGHYASYRGRQRLTGRINIRSLVTR